jgi:hypothetical protein
LLKVALKHQKSIKINQYSCIDNSHFWIWSLLSRSLNLGCLTKIDIEGHIWYLKISDQKLKPDNTIYRYTSVCGVCIHYIQIYFCLWCMYTLYTDILLSVVYVHCIHYIQIYFCLWCMYTLYTDILLSVVYVYTIYRYTSVCGVCMQNLFYDTLSFASTTEKRTLFYIGVRVMVLNATFHNISFISWWYIL